MTQRRTDEDSLAPRRSLAGNAGEAADKPGSGGTGKRPVLPPPPPDLSSSTPAKGSSTGSAAGPATRSTPAPVKEADRPTPRTPATPASGKSRPAKASETRAPRPAGTRPRSRRARLRLVQIDAWSVMKTAFLLSIAIGIVTIVAVLIVWSVLGAAGVWDSINSIVQQALGSQSGTPFQIQKYVGTSRIMGLTMVLAVLDVILITAIATLSAFLYNLAATLLGGIEVTFAEDH